MSTLQLTKNDIIDIESRISPTTQGLDKLLETPWVIWLQRKTDIIPLYRFSTVAGCWSIINNMQFNEIVRYYFMREGITPIWENKSHIGGGYCTINLIRQRYWKMFRYCLMSLIGETFLKPPNDTIHLTGLTFIHETNYMQLRIWITGIGYSSLGLKQCTVISDDVVKRFEKFYIQKPPKNIFYFESFKNIIIKNKQNKHNKHNKYNKQNEKKSYVRKNMKHGQEKEKEEENFEPKEKDDVFDGKSFEKEKEKDKGKEKEKEKEKEEENLEPKEEDDIFDEKTLKKERNSYYCEKTLEKEMSKYDDENTDDDYVDGNIDDDYVDGYIDVSVILKNPKRGITESYH